MNVYINNIRMVFISQFFEKICSKTSMIIWPVLEHGTLGIKSKLILQISGTVTGLMAVYLNIIYIKVINLF